MSTPRKPLVVRPTNRTSPGWQEFNSLPATPPPVTEALAASAPAAVNEAVPDPPARRARAGLAFVIAGGLAVAVVAALFIFFPRGRRAEESASAGTAAILAAPPTPAPEREPPPAPPASPGIPPDVPPVAKRHIEITVQPPEASLSLDDRRAEGGQIKLEVAKSKAPHLVQATAPGYVPFKKTITFAADVRLDIKLEKAEPPVSHGRTKARPPQPAEQPTVGKMAADTTVQAPAEPRVAPPPPVPVEDFGMTLQRPGTRRPTKKIDETDPYAQ